MFKLTIDPLALFHNTLRIGVNAVAVLLIGLPFTFVLLTLSPKEHTVALLQPLHVRTRVFAAIR